MRTALTVLTWVIAALHVWIFVLEAVLWQTPRGRKTFRMSAEQAAATAVLAKNQGVYNLILAAGLAWAAWTGATPLFAFFLGAVAVAGVVGGLTASRSILMVQAAPAGIGLALLALATL